MRVVVTGATGAIGIAFMNELLMQHMDVLVINHKGSDRAKRIPQSPHIKTLELDLEEYADYMPDALECGYDVFVHMAWQGTSGSGREDLQLQHRNAGYALNAVDLAKRFGCDTFIGVGSQAEYGRAEGKLTPDTPTFPETGYGIAKLHAGYMTRKRCEQLDIRHIWVRVLSVYGPNDSENSMIISTMRKLLAGEKVAFTAGEQKWDYLYCDDAARALRLLAEQGKHGQVYPLGSGEAKALAEFIYQLRDAVDPQIEITLGEIPYAQRQVMYLCADLETLKRDVGFEPEITFEEGIRRTVEWMRLEGENND